MFDFLSSVTAAVTLCYISNCWCGWEVIDQSCNAVGVCGWLGCNATNVTRNSSKSGIEQLADGYTSSTDHLFIGTTFTLSSDLSRDILVSTSTDSDSADFSSDLYSTTTDLHQYLSGSTRASTDSGHSSTISAGEVFVTDATGVVEIESTTGISIESPNVLFDRSLQGRGYKCGFKHRVLPDGVQDWSLRSARFGGRVEPIDFSCLHGCPTPSVSDHALNNYTGEYYYLYNSTHGIFRHRLFTFCCDEGFEIATNTFPYCKNVTTYTSINLCVNDESYYPFKFKENVTCVYPYKLSSSMLCCPNFGHRFVFDNLNNHKVCNYNPHYSTIKYRIQCFRGSICIDGNPYVMCEL